MGKRKNYLVRNGEWEFLLGIGESIGDGFAVVRLHRNLEPVKNGWRIIDIKSGLSVGVSYSPTKKNALERFEIKKSDECFTYTVEKSKATSFYKKCCEELEEEKEVWRTSGYEVE